MVLLAAYYLVLRNRAGTDDLIVPTFTSGRHNERFHDTVGVFFNFLPLRVDLSGCETFREVVRRTRATCLEAYTHDLPFPLIAEQAPELGSTFEDPNKSVIAFELLQSESSIDGQTIGGLTYHEIRRRVISQTVSSEIPDGVLWAMDLLPSQELVGSVKYNRNVFDESTITGLVDEFSAILRAGVESPDAPLRSLD